MGPLLIVPLPGQVSSGSIHRSDQPFCRALSGTVSHGLWVCLLTQDLPPTGCRSGWEPRAP